MPDGPGGQDRDGIMKRFMDSMGERWWKKPKVVNGPANPAGPAVSLEQADREVRAAAIRQGKQNGGKNNLARGQVRVVGTNAEGQDPADIVQ